MNESTSTKKFLKEFDVLEFFGRLCYGMMQQDAVITKQEKQIAMLEKQIKELGEIILQGLPIEEIEAARKEAQNEAVN